KSVTRYRNNFQVLMLQSPLSQVCTQEQPNQHAKEERFQQPVARESQPLNAPGGQRLERRKASKQHDSGCRRASDGSSCILQRLPQDVTFLMDGSASIIGFGCLQIDRLVADRA